MLCTENSNSYQKSWHNSIYYNWKLATMVSVLVEGSGWTGNTSVCVRSSLCLCTRVHVCGCMCVKGLQSRVDRWICQVKCNPVKPNILTVSVWLPPGTVKWQLWHPCQKQICNSQNIETIAVCVCMWVCVCTSAYIVLWQVNADSRYFYFPVYVTCFHIVNISHMI